MFAPLRSLAPATRFLFLGLVTLAVASGPARGQGPGPSVIDGAKMFSRDAIAESDEKLRKLDSTYNVVMTVETVKSLKGLGIDEVTVRKAEDIGHKGIFVLIAEQEHKVEVLASPRSLREELGQSRLFEIRDAIIDEFRSKHIDEGLIKGIQAAEKVLAAVYPARSRGGYLPSTSYETSSSSASSPLVLRQQVRLTLAGARKAIAGAEAKAAKEGWKMNIAVVDDGGHMLAFERMDGARPSSVATSTTKAVTAATFRQATGPIGAAGAPPDVLLNLSLQNASGGKLTTLLGGIPIVVDGQVIGAIGVGGGSSEQDAEAAKAGFAAFLEGLHAKTEEAKPKETEPKTKEGDAKTKEDAPTTAKPAGGEASPK